MEEPSTCWIAFRNAPRVLVCVHVDAGGRALQQRGVRHGPSHDRQRNAGIRKPLKTNEPIDPFFVRSLDGGLDLGALGLGDGLGGAFPPNANFGSAPRGDQLVVS